MRINDLNSLNNYQIVLKRLYWAWLFICLLFWFCLALGHFLQPIKGWAYDFLSFVFDSKFGIFLLFSPLLIPIIFIKISINSRKVLTWELGVITLIWGLVFYVVPHLRT